jgi:hypothetical protein
VLLRKRRVNSKRKNVAGRLVSGASDGHLTPIRRLGNKARPKEKRERATPMLAKRIIVAAFAVAVVIGVPFAFPGQSDLFVDTPPGLMTALASAN